MRNHLTRRRIGSLAVLGLTAAAWAAAAWAVPGEPAAVADAGKAGVAAAAEWREWRGPKRDGLSTEKGLLQAWPAGGPALAWKATGIGEGFASVAVADGRIYTTGDKDGSACAFGLDPAGKILWTTKIGPAGVQGKRPGPRGTPTVAPDGALIYTMTQFGDLACLESATGKLVWKKSLSRDLNGKMMSGWGYSESVLLDGDRLICTPGGAGGTLAALDRKTGNELWRTKDWTDSAAYSSPLVAQIGGKKQYVQFTGASLAGVDPETGKLLWRADRPGKTAIVSTPVIQDGLIFVTSGYNIGCDLFKVTRDGEAFKTEKLYSNKEMVNHHGGVILLDGHVFGYSDSSGWTCIELKTGKAKWAERSVGKGAIAYADGRFYLRSEGRDGTMALIEASPAGYKEHGRFNQPDRSTWQSWPHPVIAGGKLYVRDMDVLLCYDVATK